MKKIAIYGAGGLGKEVATLITDINKVRPTWELVGFFDDLRQKGEEVYGLPILGGRIDVKTLSGELIIAIGDPFIKTSIIKAIADYEISYATLIHPSALLMDYNSIHVREGAIITAGSILTTNIGIGKHVLINLNSTIGHDVYVGDFSSIMCGVNIGGSVKLETGVFIGSGANIINNMTIGKNCKIGAGAVVINDIEADKTVVGVPAREI